LGRSIAGWRLSIQGKGEDEIAGGDEQCCVNEITGRAITNWMFIAQFLPYCSNFEQNECPVKCRLLPLRKAIMEDRYCGFSDRLPVVEMDEPPDLKRQREHYRQEYQHARGHQDRSYDNVNHRKRDIEREAELESDHGDSLILSIMNKVLIPVSGPRRP